MSRLDTTPPGTDEGARVVRLVRSASRARTVLLVLAVLVPLAVFLLFERQARRLDALGDHGALTTATVTGVSQSYAWYAYEVSGARYTWSVSAKDAPAAGERFEVLYLPEDPALTRPWTDRARATAEAARNRRFSTRVVAGVFAFFALFAALAERSARRLRARGARELGDPQALRERMVLSAGIVLVMVFAVGAWHASDALERGKSVWPVLLGGALSLGVIAGTWRYVLRDGPAQVRVRSARLMRWVAPLAVLLAVLRALAWVAGAH